MSDHPDPLLRHMAEQIAPLFGSLTPDDAYAAAVSALTAYDPQSRADYVSIAQILAFSTAALTALGLAATTDMPPAQKLRCFGRANTLNRSASQAERLMMQRRRDQRAGFGPGPLVNPELDEAEQAMIRADVAEAMEAYCVSKQADRAEPLTPPAPPPGPVTPRPVAAPSVAETAIAAVMPLPRLANAYRDTLLQHSAMHRVIGDSPVRPST